MKKLIALLVVVSFLMLLIPLDSSAGSRGHGRGYYRGYGHGYHGGGHYGRGYGYYDRYYWRDLGATMAIIGGLAVTGAIINAPYYNRGCTREIHYGHWKYNSYGRYWVTTHIEYESVPCY